MRNTSLYRKYRPETFDKVIGQEHITSVLEQSVKNENFAHAYLFSGSRGIGKTSVARIFARAIGTEEHDLYELDAASNRGIDDMRELREGVHAQPYSSPYKVYIIDEVHMLSKDAFNALLKTLEEPPRHVVFILATTEPEKIPETIISRCTLFHFKRPTVDMLRDVVIDIAKKEKLGITKSSAELIAILGDGSFRDTTSVLQKVLSAQSAPKMTDDEVARLLGAPKTELLNSFLESFAKGDLENTLAQVEMMKDAGVEMDLFHTLTLSRLRSILLLRYGNKFLKDEVAKMYSEKDLGFLENLSKEAKNINAEVLRAFLELEPLIAIASIKTLPLELMLIESFGEKE
jgi:DNA polymerase III subunit gamma/tau